MTYKTIKAIIANIAAGENIAENIATLINNAVDHVKKTGRALTIDDVKKLYGLHVTQKHTGKMSGMLSLSTNMLINKFCLQHRNICGSICQHCYANTLLTMRQTMQKALTYNSILLKNAVLPLEILPRINSRVFRFESFGDLDNVNRAINYLNICRVNPETTFALWTKNPVILNRAFKAGYTKPENLIIIYSSLFVNDVQSGLRMKRVYKWIDKVFTVYDKETIKRDNIAINCGARSCFTCRRCYSKDTETIINEQLK